MPKLSYPVINNPLVLSLVADTLSVLLSFVILYGAELALVIQLFTSVSDINVTLNTPATPLTTILSSK